MVDWTVGKLGDYLVAEKEERKADSMAVSLAAA